jgi:tRNA1Val (adenine37-N6)-methyltransferase
MQEHNSDPANILRKNKLKRINIKSKLPGNFQFKKFTIRQEGCSMKVCTDSCLFGAWAAAVTEAMNAKPKTILDMGTGTGLLSLMLAQKCTAEIHAVEVDQASYARAAGNFTASPWSEHLQAFHADVKEWKAPCTYDFIISNPPFYQNDLMPEDNGKSVAKHSSMLRLEDLLLKVKDLLNDNGSFAVLLPSSAAKRFENAAAVNSLFVKEKMEVKQTPLHRYFRTMLLLQNQKTGVVKSGLTIKNKDNKYTSEFTGLLKDYYLYL